MDSADSPIPHSHQSAGDHKTRYPGKLYAVVVMGRDPETNRKKKELLTFLRFGSAKQLFARAKQMNPSDETVVLMEATVTDWREVDKTWTDTWWEEQILSMAEKQNAELKRRAKVAAMARIRVRRRRRAMGG